MTFSVSSSWRLRTELLSWWCRCLQVMPYMTMQTYSTRKWMHLCLAGVAIVLPLISWRVTLLGTCGQHVSLLA